MISSRPGSIMSVLLVAVALAAPALGQSGLRGPGPSIGGFQLLALPAVQQELHMDDAQVEKSKEVVKRMKARYEQDMGKLKGLKGDEQMKRVVTLAGPHYEEGMKQLRVVLRPEQVDRFDQILFQQRGPMAMLEPPIQKVLQVTNQQAEQVARIFADAQNEQKAVVQASGGKPTPEALAKFADIAEAANTKAAALLSPEQKRSWARITGEPFRPDTRGVAGPTDAKP